MMTEKEKEISVEAYKKGIIDGGIVGMKETLILIKGALTDIEKAIDEKFIKCEERT